MLEMVGIQHCILISISTVVCLEINDYQITSNIPTYLNKYFNGLTESIFPSDIQIELSLTRVAGTLLYSIDSNNNQLIVSLSESDLPTLDIQVNNNKREFLKIPNLCGCGQCHLEKLRLRIQMRDKMYLQCNQGQNFSIVYSKGGLNKNYPRPFLTKSDKLSASLWLVNTPAMDGLDPNGEQLEGCIHRVFYNGDEVRMGNHSVKSNCRISCTNNTCNGGTCKDNFTGQPYCDCTYSFMNGQYCNDSLKRMNVNISQMFIPKVVKMSLLSASDEIIDLNARLMSLRVFSKDEQFLFRVSCYKEMVVSSDAIISNQYRKGDHHILLIEIEEKVVILKYRNGGTKWFQGSIPYSCGAERLQIINVVVRSGEGRIDVVYKEDLKKSQWMNLNFNESTKLSECYTVKSVKCQEVKSTSRWDYLSKMVVANHVLLVFILVGVVSLIIVFLAFNCGKNMKWRRHRRNPRI